MLAANPFSASCSFGSDKNNVLLEEEYIASYLTSTDGHLLSSRPFQLKKGELPHV
jgi:hypothetical protein